MLPCAEQVENHVWGHWRLYAGAGILLGVKYYIICDYVWFFIMHTVFPEQTNKYNSSTEDKPLWGSV